MPSVKLKIDISGSVGEEVWHNLRHFDSEDSSFVEFQHGSRETCKHPAGVPHAQGESIGATIHLETVLLAQYAVAHYLEQDRVLDGDVEDDDAEA